jgi:hypothetical protein
MWTLLLGAVYYLVLTPVALVVRLVRDPLRRRWDPRRHTYWDDLAPVRKDQRTVHPGRRVRATAR